jgi:sugar lactone lactonase YvrE
VYIADTVNNRVRKVTISTGIITTVAGSGGTSGSYSGDNGSATAATLKYTRGVVVDAAGNVYIADTTNNRIRKVTISTGIITSIAGSTTSGAYSGDGGAATSAVLNSPSGLSLDSAGNVYIADQLNYRIRKVTVSTGIINTFAGDGSAAYRGDNGDATSAALYYPTGVAVDLSGKICVIRILQHSLIHST